MYQYLDKCKFISYIEFTVKGTMRGKDEGGRMKDELLMKDKKWGILNKPLEVIENKEYHCAHIG